MTRLQKLAVGFLAAVMLVVLGCAAFQDAITPCRIDSECVEFADANLSSFPPWNTIADAEYVKRRMEYIRSLSEIEYGYLTQNMDIYMANAQQLQQTLFSPQSLGMLIPALSGLGLGGILIKRPQDKREIESLKNGQKTNS